MGNAIVATRPDGSDQEARLETGSQGQAGRLQGIAPDGARRRHDQHPQREEQTLDAVARRRTAYGSIDDWVLLYCVWVDEAGRIEHDARRHLVRYRELRMYDKEGHRQKGREIVNCRFGIALEALEGLLDDAQLSAATKSWRAAGYEFGWTPPPPDPPPYVPLPPPGGIPAAIHLL